MLGKSVVRGLQAIAMVLAWRSELLEKEVVSVALSSRFASLSFALAAKKGASYVIGRAE